MSRPVWSPDLTDPAARHPISRIRRDTRRRTLTVTAAERLTPHLLRLHFRSPDLADFDSGAPDDLIKLFLPDGAGGVAARDYTPRAFDTAAETLVIDFALHEPAGLATAWAMAAVPGDTLEIGGPRGSTIVPDDFDWYLLIGDETAIPAITRRLEELRLGVPVTALIAVENADDRLPIPDRAGLTMLWSPRADDPAADADRLLGLLDAQPLPPGDGFVWIGAEATVARAVRAVVLGRLGHPAAWTKASGYWVAGAAGAHEKIGD